MSVTLRNRLLQGVGPVLKGSGERDRTKKTFLKSSSIHGRGVFASTPFRAGETIETVPVLIVSERKETGPKAGSIESYLYRWGANGELLAAALGNGSFYNHSYSPNVVYHPDIRYGLIRYVALRDIRENEELLINYNRDPEDLSPLWFNTGKDH